MSEPITRRKILVDYRIRAAKCENCGRVYFPPKSFCDIEGRGSRMQEVDHFYKNGTLLSCNVIRGPTKKFDYLKSFLAGIIHFPGDNLKVPGRITDYIPPAEEVDVTEFIGREVVPRFRKTFTDGASGLIYYSSMNFSFEDDYYPFQEYRPVKPSVSENGSKPGIVGYGVYLPKYRIKNEGNGVLGVVERTLPFADEDTTTFAVEAGKRALIHSAIESRRVKKCFVGSESAPYAVNPSMSTVSQVLELGEPYEGGFFSGGIDSQFACKAATDLFIDAAALVAYSTFGGEYVMVIGADNSQAAAGDPLDYTVGAGGAAFIFGKRDVIATLDCYVPYTSDTPDFYRRAREEYPKHGGRFTGVPAYFKHVGTAMRAAMEACNLTPGDIQYVACHSPNGKFPYQAAIEAGFNREQIEPGLVVRYIGNLYSASCPTALAAVLDIAKPGDKILMTSYGSGAGSEAYIFTVTEEIEQKRERSVTVREQIENPHREYVDYSTYRRWKESS
jgi:hydroxymethylglutaryl-CoA synthase